MEEKDKQLTPKQETFCQKYLETGNATEAYRYAYNSQKMKPETITNAAYKLLQRGDIRARIEYLRQHLAEAANISALRIVRELERIAFADATSIRRSWGDLKDFDSLTDAERAIIKDIDVKVKCTTTASGNDIVETTTRVSMHDKLKAIENLTQMLGFNGAVKVEAEVKGNNQVKISFGNMTPEQFAICLADIKEQEQREQEDE